MLGDEARVLLGFPANSRPSPSQVKAAYRKKVWESHPDLFPVGEKSKAESKFKLISEAYTSLVSDKKSSLHKWNIHTEFAWF
ncbi:dnaJ homolog subfamily B member 8 isoform X2 [Tripterygium wilfordii]|uniref:dnaJ homolog subfamily B member 8 isoform X2 n=1 Tax=Tripterygium wilfordii TaxID=458696 RepID=UPI0018F83A63|nr:dnaJ homolog subfamily B member 8 isoform X2 [Tripterygium wilfordii]